MGAKTGERDLGGATTLRVLAAGSPAESLAMLRTSGHGITASEAAARCATVGFNRVAREARPSLAIELWRQAATPLTGLLLILAAASEALGDPRAATLIAIMVALSIGLGFLQEHRANAAAARLYEMVRTRVSVRRPEAPDTGFVEVPIEDLAPGDVVRLAAGAMIPADLRLLSATGLYVNQAALTGESMPAEKRADAPAVAAADLFDAPNLAFMGSNVTSGYGEAVVVRTGDRTDFGRLARSLAALAPPTSFDRGIAAYTWLMVRVILVMAPLVFLINGVTKGDWLEALFFSVAVAVGLTPEMLPMIVTVNLAQGALAMSRKKVIVKRLNAIQNFGAMDILCTDKTGTLTEDRVVLKLHLDVRGEDSDEVLAFAYLNSRYESGLNDLLDAAVLAHVELDEGVRAEGYRKIGEIPFDFQRRRLSVALAAADGRRLLVCKGAVEEVFACCTRYRLGQEEGPLDASHAASARALTARLNDDGFRVVAVACRDLASDGAALSVADERDLTLLGYIGFLDPAKADVGPAIAALGAAGVSMKVLTGDNAAVAAKICRDVGVDAGRICLGDEIDRLDDADLGRRAESVCLFAKVSPAQKARVIAALQGLGHVVGFLGDGINDGPALKMADVGISVDSAVDIAKESADIILLEKSLAVLQEGVLEGRRVFGNITKYIKMGASSAFGNVLSVVGASLFLPFLPMTPIQVLANNLLYDLSQTAIPTDRVDAAYLARPRRWDIGRLLRFMVCIGPISSLFDYATFWLMLTVFHANADPALFQTGWFVESLLTQTLIVHIIRTARIPFVQSRASVPLIVTTVATCAVGAALPYSPLAGLIGLRPLPWLFWPTMAVFMLAYGSLVHRAKTWFIRRWGD